MEELYAHVTLDINKKVEIYMKKVEEDTYRVAWKIKDTNTKDILSVDQLYRGDPENILLQVYRDVVHNSQEESMASDRKHPYLRSKSNYDESLPRHNGYNPLRHW